MRALVALTLVAFSSTLPSTTSLADDCHGDFNYDGRVTVDELVTAVNYALDGCPAGPSPTPRPTPTPTPSSALRDLLGTWTFQFTIATTFYDHYRLESIHTTAEGKPYIGGTDLDDGGVIVVTETTGLDEDFALLDAGILLCDFYAFDKTGPDRVAGVHFMFYKSGPDCSSDFVSPIPDPMLGVRTARGAAATVPDPLLSPHVLELREQLAIAEAESFGAAGETLRPTVDPAYAQSLEALAALLRAPR